MAVLVFLAKDRLEKLNCRFSINFGANALMKSLDKIMSAIGAEPLADLAEMKNSAFYVDYNRVFISPAARIQGTHHLRSLVSLLVLDLKRHINLLSSL